VVIPPLVCPNCCEDLYARPPRSYAELEGIRDFELAQDEVRASAHRWARRARIAEFTVMLSLGAAVLAMCIWQFIDTGQLPW
jgi:hypothetical protein